MSQSIAIVKTSSLGDLVHTFPVISYLKKRFPNSIIDWIVESPFSPLIAAHPHIDQTISVDTKSWRGSLFSSQTRKEIKQFRSQVRKKQYDFVFDLQGNFKSALLTSQIKAKEKIGFSWESAPEKINCLFTNKRYTPPSKENIRSDYLSIVQQHFKDSNPFQDPGVQLICPKEDITLIDEHLPSQKKTLLVCPSAHWENKRLSIETLISLLEKIQKNTPFYFLFLWGNDQERKTAEELQNTFSTNSLVFPKLSLPGLQNLMYRCDQILAMDSFPLHLASTTTTPTWSVFGPSSANKYAPIGPEHQSVQGPCPYGKTFEKRCPALRTCKMGACLKELRGEEIYAKLIALSKPS